jgi:propanol-preferring alcohol dehydrogenase
MAMQAAVLHQPAPLSTHPLHIEELPIPEPGPGEVLLRVEACGVCRTDLHIVTGELKPRLSPVIPGHQIVGRVVKYGPGSADIATKASEDQRDEQGEATRRARSTRVGVSWLGGVDGTCALCRRGLENLCDRPTFTGYTVHGGYAQYAVARADFLVDLPEDAPAAEIAPLLCAGIIGFRSLRVAGVEHGDRVGLFGFGASAHLAIDVLKAWNCEVYVSTRGASHQQLARSLGATWVGEATERPPVQLDRAVTFAPSGQVVIAALSSLRKGGVVAINAIHLDQMPAFDYDSLLWGERQIRSVANMTRADARDFVALATKIGIRPRTTLFPLADVNNALAAIQNDAIDGAAVVVCE